LQQRDFVNVRDIAHACRLAVEAPDVPGRAINIGSGQPRTILEIARRMAQVLGKEQIEPEIAGKYRVGDIRHCFADIRLAKRLLGYEPRVNFEEGLQELASWLATQNADDRVAAARDELHARGLAI